MDRPSCPTLLSRFKAKRFECAGALEAKTPTAACVSIGNVGLQLDRGGPRAFLLHSTPNAGRPDLAFSAHRRPCRNLNLSVAAVYRISLLFPWPERSAGPDQSTGWSVDGISYNWP